MVGARGALLSFATRFRLRGIEARGGCRSIPWAGLGTSDQKSMGEAFLQEKVACLDGTMMKKRPRRGFAEADRIIHHVP